MLLLSLLATPVDDVAPSHLTHIMYTLLGSLIAAVLGWVYRRGLARAFGLLTTSPLPLRPLKDRPADSPGRTFAGLARQEGGIALSEFRFVLAFRSIKQDLLHGQLTMRASERDSDTVQTKDFDVTGGALSGEKLLYLAFAPARRPGQDERYRENSGMLVFTLSDDGKSIDGGYTGYGSTSEQMVNGSYHLTCLLYTSPSPRDRTRSRMPSSA